MAGESARESARRQREKAERLARSAELWQRGADGEATTAAALAALPAEEWAVFHDVTWPGRRSANIDHVVVGPGGVFVVDSKNWSGRITVEQDVLRQNGRRRENAVAGVAEAALALTPIVAALDVRTIVPVICFVRDEPVTGRARDVMVCSTGNLVTMLTSRPRVVTGDEVRRTIRHLDSRLEKRGLEKRGLEERRTRDSGPGQTAPQPRPAIEGPPAERRPDELSPARRRRRATQAGSRGRRRGRPTAADRLRLALAVVVLTLLLARPDLLRVAADWVAGQFLG